MGVSSASAMRLPMMPLARSLPFGLMYFCSLTSTSTRPCLPFRTNGAAHKHFSAFPSWLLFGDTYAELVEIRML